MKMLLYSSYLISAEHNAALGGLVGKNPRDITIAAIANATDIVPDADWWVSESRDALTRDGAQVEAVDLREWLGDRDGLRAKLASKDVIWMSGGHIFYLRWILRETGADEMIRELVENGTVLACWSAPLAGPTLRHFELVDDPKDAPETIWDGLGLTDTVVIPHTDLDEFAAPMQEIGRLLRADGFATELITEAQAFLVDGDERRII